MHVPNAADERMGRNIRAVSKDIVDIVVEYDNFCL